MQDDIKSIDMILGDPKNPRRMSEHQGNALKNSMEKFGDLSCIVFNERTQQLVGGHQRIAIMKRLPTMPYISITQRIDRDDVGTVAYGYVFIAGKQFACRLVDWDEGTQHAANIAANKIQGEFDNDLLAQVTYELSQLDNGAELLALTGMQDEEISKLLNSVSGSDENQDLADSPQCTKCQLHCGMNNV